MKLVAQIQLRPSAEQTAALTRTLETANAAANAASEYAWRERTFRANDLHRACYYDLRERFGLTAQMAVRVLAKVADSYKTGDHHIKRTDRPLGSMAYDARILRYNVAQQSVSIWTMDGRQSIPFIAGERQRKLLERQQGESDLVYRKGRFYLLATCELDDPDPIDVDAALGVDLGIVNLATDSDAETYSGDRVEHVRRRYSRRRAALQAVGTKSAKRRLKTMSGRQRRFQADTNHVIRKRIVAKAERTNRAIVVEELTHIRSRSRVRGRTQRARHSNWSFRQLRAFLSYKATLAGVPLVAVDAAYTSQRCSACGHTERANRRSQAEFCCRVCSHTLGADYNAALNLERAACQPANGIRPSGLGASRPL